MHFLDPPLANRCHILCGLLFHTYFILIIAQGVNWTIRSILALRGAILSVLLPLLYSLYPTLILSYKGEKVVKEVFGTLAFIDQDIELRSWDVILQPYKMLVRPYFK